MKTPEIRVLEAMLLVCSQMSRGQDMDLAAAASERHAKLSQEHAKLMRAEANTPRQRLLELAHDPAA